MFDASRKCPATHDPGPHSELLSFNRAQHNRNLSQRSKLVLVVHGHKKGGRIVEKGFPGRVAQSLAVQVKLVGFINQLESPAISRLFSKTKLNGGFGALKE